MLCFGNVYHHIAFFGRLADDHALVAILARADEQLATLLQRIEGVCYRLLGGHGNHAAVLAADHLTGVGAVLTEMMEQDRFAVRSVQDLGLQAHGAARGDGEREVRHVLVGNHVLHNAAGGAHNLDGLAGVIVGHVDGCFLDRLELVAVCVGLVHNLRAANLEFEAFAAHGFHQNGQMQNATAGNANARLIRRFLDAHGNVAFLFTHQALFQLTGAHDIAFATNQRAGGSLEHYSHRRLFYRQGLHFNRVLRVGNNIADVRLLHADNSHDVACACLGNFGLAKVLEGVHLADLRVVAVAVGLDDQHLFLFMDGTALQAADADTAFVAAVVNRANLKGHRTVDVNVGAGDLVDDGIEQGNHVHVAVVGVVAGIAVYRRSVYHGEVELFVGCAKLNHKVEHLVYRSIGVRVRAVDLVHNHHDAQAALEGVGKNEAGLGLRALVRINDEQGAIGHVQNALYLATEVGVARRVDNVDLDALVMNGNVLRENGDAALTFLIVGVKHALGNFLVLAEYVRRPEQAVDQGGFTVVNVRNDSHIADVFLFHLLLPS